MTSFPKRGTIRDDLSPGLRVVGFERNSVIAITVTEKVETILRVFYGSRDVDGLMK
jgi:plasmid stabilization system protein ParE